MATKKRTPVRKKVRRTATRPAATLSGKAASRATLHAAGDSSDAGRARTIIYVHGIGNKPVPEVLKCQWDEALFGFNLGERSRLAYWVNRIFYPQPTKASCKMADATLDGAPDTGSVGMRAIADPAEGVEPLLPSDATSQRERNSLERIADQLLEETGAPRGEVRTADFQTRVLPLPKPVREFITRRITKAFLKDVHEFLFVKERREIMRESMLSRLRTGGGPFIVIAHSQGSMVAYDVLSSLPADQFEVLYGDRKSVV